MRPIGNESSLSPHYPGHSLAFAELLDDYVAGVHKNSVAAREWGTALLREVRDDELVLLLRLGIDQEDPDLSRTAEAELARRNIDATTQNLGAVRELQTSVQLLHKTIDTTGSETTAVLQDLRTALDELKAATTTWSAWLTRLTIGILALTSLLVVLAVSQVVNR